MPVPIGFSIFEALLWPGSLRFSKDLFPTFPSDFSSLLLLLIPAPYVWQDTGTFWRVKSWEDTFLPEPRPLHQLESPRPMQGPWNLGAEHLPEWTPRTCCWGSKDAWLPGPQGWWRQREDGEERRDRQKGDGGSWQHHQGWSWDEWPQERSSAVSPEPPGKCCPALLWAVPPLSDEPGWLPAEDGAGELPGPKVAWETELGQRVGGWSVVQNQNGPEANEKRIGVRGREPKPFWVHTVGPWRSNDRLAGRKGRECRQSWGAAGLGGCRPYNSQ